MKIAVKSIPIFTLLGKWAYRYKLSDFSYGEWVIFENNKPKFYLNIFDSEYDEVRLVFSKSKNYDLEKKLKSHNKGLSIYQKLLGITFLKKTFLQVIELEKLPKHILTE